MIKWKLDRKKKEERSSFLAVQRSKVERDPRRGHLSSRSVSKGKQVVPATVEEKKFKRKRVIPAHEELGVKIRFPKKTRLQTRYSDKILS